MTFREAIAVFLMRFFVGFIVGGALGITWGLYLRAAGADAAFQARDSAEHETAEYRVLLSVCAKSLLDAGGGR